MNKLSKKTLDYINNYQKENYDKISLSLKKGMKETIRNRSEELGMNVSEYVRYCVERYVEHYGE